MNGQSVRKTLTALGIALALLVGATQFNGVAEAKFCPNPPFCSLTQVGPTITATASNGSGGQVHGTGFVPNSDVTLTFSVSGQYHPNGVFLTQVVHTSVLGSFTSNFGLPSPGVAVWCGSTVTVSSAPASNVVHFNPGCIS